MEDWSTYKPFTSNFIEIPNKAKLFIESIIWEEIKRKELKQDSDNLGGLVRGGKTSKNSFERKKVSKKEEKVKRYKAEEDKAD